MNELEKLPKLIAHAIQTLERATTAAEVLDAKSAAGVAYAAAKTAAHLAKITKAHEKVLEACHKTQADALVIESRAQIRLAEEYDAAQKRKEVAGAQEGRPRRSSAERRASAADIGVSRKQVHEARKVRDAELKEPGVVKKAVEAELAAGKEPTRTKVRSAVGAALSGSRKIKIEGATTGELYDKARRLVRPYVRADKPVNREKLREYGFTNNMLERAALAEQAVMEAEAEFIEKGLSLSAQEKVELVVKQKDRERAAKFEQRVRKEVSRQISEAEICPDCRRALTKCLEAKSRAHSLSANNVQTLNLN